MKQAAEPGFYWDPDTKQEVEIRAGAVRADNHQDVLRCPTIFRDLPVMEDAPVPPVRPAARPRPAKG